MSALTASMTVSQADYVIEPKIDGLTVVLHYHNGVLVQGATAEMAKSAKILPPICAPFALFHCAFPLIHRTHPAW